MQDSIGTKTDQPGRDRAQDVARRALAVKTALVALRMYKVWLSPLIGGTCRFQPTCSEYMYEAIERFGVGRGVWLGTKRLLRCHPFSRRFGHDHVPEQHELEKESSLENLNASERARRIELEGAGLRDDVGLRNVGLRNEARS